MAFASTCATARATGSTHRPTEQLLAVLPAPAADLLASETTSRPSAARIERMPRVGTANRSTTL